MVMSISEQLMYCTFRIEAYDSLGQLSTGTGFSFRMAEKETGECVAVIVTNKHVVRGSTIGRLAFHLSDENGNPSGYHWVSIPNFEAQWIMHPNNDIDICAMPVSTVLNQLAQAGLKPFFVGLSYSLVPTEDQWADLNSIEDIIMIGYPNGIWDEKNNLPVVRRGITATHPAFDYNEKKEFLIDAACFPGSSGSPVFLLNVGSYTDKRGNVNLGTGRVFLLGILYAGPQYVNQGEVRIVDIPTVQSAVSVSMNMLNLGYIIKSSLLAEIDAIIKDRVANI